MKLELSELIQLIKYAIFSGAFSCISLFCFSIAMHSLTPKINIFNRFYESDNLSRWFHYNVFDLEMLLINMAFLTLAVVISTAGLGSVLFAKHFYGLSSDVLKSITHT